MNICMPVRTQEGLQSCISAQFSLAEHWLIFNTESRGYRVIDLAHDEGPVQVDLVLCQEINRSSLRRFQSQNIEVAGTTAERVQAALDGFADGKYSAPVIACANQQEAGHSHQHAHQHGCGGHGRGHGHGACHEEGRGSGHAAPQEHCCCAGHD
jgi:predicted Fe-Mo cluster-binding NifX family protein